MPMVDRDQFMQDGYLVIRDLIPSHELQQLRASYDVLLERQKEIWQSQRGPGDPPGGAWDTSPQPRIQNAESLIDATTANAVEVWTSNRTRGVAEHLLSQPVAGISAMMVMCNPTFEHGPANWHRDVHPVDMGPMRTLQGSLVENGPNYVQWNIPLYDDDVLWVIPGSHTRLNTEAENSQLRENPRAPLPGGVPVDLRAGDGLVYVNYLLHWGSDYTSRVLRRTLHGGHTTYPNWQDIDFTRYLSPEARELFGSWRTRTTALKDATEGCLRAVLDQDRQAYLDGLQLIHSGVGEAGQLQITVWLCKLAMNVHLLARSDFECLPSDVRRRVQGTHAITLNWGPSFAQRFTQVEADGIWNGFSDIERHLKCSDGDDFVPGYQSGPIPYYLDEMREPFTIRDFGATWADPT